MSAIDKICKAYDRANIWVAEALRVPAWPRSYRRAFILTFPVSAICWLAIKLIHVLFAIFGFVVILAMLVAVSVGSAVKEEWEREAGE